MKLKSMFLVVNCICLLTIFTNKVFGFVSVDNAVSWAEGRIGETYDSQCSQAWANMCMHFCGHAYGQVPSNIYDANAGWNASEEVFGEKHTSNDFSLIPKGALVFFNLTSNGHVGLAVGNGKMVHAWTSGVIKSDISGYSSYYRGWRWPHTWTQALFMGFRIVNETGWYPPTKTCINAESWVRVRYGRAIQSMGSNSICYEEYIRNPTYQSILLGSGSLPQECTQ